MKKLTKSPASNAFLSKTSKAVQKSAAKANKDTQVYLAGQDIQRSSKGNIFRFGAIDIKDGPSQGDIVHGANKYKTKDGNVEDLDFMYRPSTRKSSQGDNVKHWSITGVR